MFKRLFDIVVAGLLLVFLSPVMLLASGLIFFRLGSPIFFRQSRPGLNQAPFKIIKFRTMTDAVDSQGNYLTDEQRLTKLGQFFRATSVDELPELWNVIKGEMSLVGPRPLLMEYLPLYNKDQLRRHKMRPGITGWAQVNGRNAMSWEKKFECDVWYVDNSSFLLDIKILLLTIIKVFMREGIHSEGQVTAERFEGTAASDV